MGTLVLIARDTMDGRRGIPDDCLAAVTVNRIDGRTVAFDIGCTPGMLKTLARLQGLPQAVDDPGLEHTFFSRYELYAGKDAPTGDDITTVAELWFTPSPDDGPTGVECSFPGPLDDSEIQGVRTILDMLSQGKDD